MKKLTAVFLSLILLLSLGACGSQTKESTKADVTEKATEAATKAPTKPSQTEAPTEKATKKATEPPTTAEPATVVPTTAAPPKPTKPATPEPGQITLGDTFRVIIPEDWKETDGSYLANKDRITIDFYAMKVQTGDFKLPDGTKLTDNDFAEKWVDYLNQIGFYENYTLRWYESVSNPGHQKAIRTNEKGLTYCEMRLDIIEKGTDPKFTSDGCWIEVYEWNEEQYLMIVYQWIKQSMGSPLSKQCSDKIHATLERIK